MKTVPRLRVVSSPDSPEPAMLQDLPDEVRLALAGIAGAALRSAIRRRTGSIMIIRP
jgi:hypothetical protein